MTTTPASSMASRCRRSPPCPRGVLGTVEQELCKNLPFAQAIIDDGGVLAVGQIIYLRGGVTEAGRQTS